MDARKILLFSKSFTSNSGYNTNVCLRLKKLYPIAPCFFGLVHGNISPLENIFLRRFVTKE
jgi:hypothetical protein